MTDDPENESGDVVLLGGGLADRARRLDTLTAGEREWIAASTGDWLRE